MNVEESLAAIARIQPAQALLTHLAHEIDYRSAANDLDLPEAVTVACDGLRLSFKSGEPCAMIAPPSP
jgi:phosphoribosyl 1,2-cyclic phosphodiesterase